MKGIAKNIPKNHKIGWMCPYLDESDSSLQWLVPIRLYYKWDKGGLIHTLESPHHVFFPIAVNPYFYLLWPAITFNLNIPQPPPCHPLGIWAYQPMTVVPGWMPKPLRLRNQCTGCFTSAARWGGGVVKWGLFSAWSTVDRLEWKLMKPIESPQRLDLFWALVSQQHLRDWGKLCYTWKQMRIDTWESPNSTIFI